jgi:hypothetical protein
MHGVEQVSHPRQRPGGRSIDYRHYLRELSRKPQALRQVAHVLVAQLGEPYPRLWERLIASHGELDGARMLGDVLAVVRSEGEEAVRHALRSAIGRDRLDLHPLIVTPRCTAAVPVPEALADVKVESGSAKAYDELLGSGWLQ